MSPTAEFRLNYLAGANLMGVDLTKVEYVMRRTKEHGENELYSEELDSEQNR